MIVARVATMTLTLAAACARGTPAPQAAQGERVSPGAAPALELLRLIPDTATIADGRIVVVRAIGRGFDATDNVVEFGPVVFTRVRASATRDTINFTVPLELPSSGGAPPAPVYPGEYSVTVRVGNARSAARTFRILEPRAAR
ncbi:MAG TPA: hypothetical protein VJR92_11900 [Gemmatimonadaceae bacterium]|nr:hypothetical protein [Gemmatimonadaceae bacterium]